MIGAIKFLQKRPSDNTIKFGRIIFGLILSGSLYYNLIYQGDAIETTYFGVDISENAVIYIKYIFASLGLIPLFMGITNICVLKKKYMRYLQAFFGIILFYISGKIVSGSNIDVDTLILLMGFIPLVAGITGKCITTKCLKYKEKITKIRV